MAITWGGVCGAPVYGTPGSNILNIPFTKNVLRSTEEEAAFVLVFVEAVGADHAAGIFAIASKDSAPKQGCYGTKYGTGNAYFRLVSHPIAFQAVQNPNGPETHDTYLGCILHDCRIGDIATVTFVSNFVWARGWMMEMRGANARPLNIAPLPFQFSNTYQGKDWNWNRFAETLVHNADGAGGFHAQQIYPTFMFPSGPWTAPGLGVLSTAWGWEESALTSFHWYNPVFSPVKQFFRESPASMTTSVGVGHLASPADSFTDFGGYYNTATRADGSSQSDYIDAIVFNEGLGPLYDNPAACPRAAGAIPLDQVRFRILNPGTTP
jgi:hypothetical protein